MTTSDINEQLYQMGNTWENFKSLNDEHLANLDDGRSSDPLIMEQLQRMNIALDEQKNKIQQLEVAFKRPMLEQKSNSLVEANETNMEYKQAFDNYLRKGIEGNLDKLEKKTGVDAFDGGYLVLPAMQQVIRRNLEDASAMRRICSVQEISTSKLDVINDLNNFSVSWGNSTTPVNDSESAYIERVAIEAFELTAQPKATQQLIEDSCIDLEAWLADRLSYAFMDAEDDAFINGPGVNAPTGILSYRSDVLTRVKSTSKVDGEILADDIFALYYDLNETYTKKATFLTNREVIQRLRTIKDKNDQYIWQPGLTMGAGDTLLGAPVCQSSHMPAPAAGSLSVLFGDFRYYQIVDRTGIRILRDPYTAKPYVRFYTTKRVGGDVVRGEAFRVLALGKATA